VSEVRPLRIHDLPFAYRLAGQGVSFDSQVSLTIGDDGLRQALLTSTGRLQVYVLRRAQGGALGQLHFLPGAQHARLAYVAPAPAAGADDTTWLHLLDGMTVMAGQRGAVSILAEVNEDHAAYSTLRLAGFATYVRQQIWKRPASPAGAVKPSLRMMRPDELPAMSTLYGSLVPGLIKHIEPPPTVADDIYLLRGRRGLCGMALVYEGQHAALIEPFLAPDASSRDGAFLGDLLALLQGERRPLYCRIRDYMGCLTSTLEAAGFVQQEAQVAMFRYTAARIAHQGYKLMETVEGSVPQPTSIVEDDEAPATLSPIIKHVR
jgi:hypothetical protein